MRMDPELLYDLEMQCRKGEWGDSAVLYDEGKDLFRFVDGKISSSRDQAD